MALPNFIWLERRLSVPFRSGMDGKTLGSSEKLMTCLQTQLPFERRDFRCLGHCEHAHFDGLFAHASLPLLATRSFSDFCGASLPFFAAPQGPWRKVIGLYLFAQCLSCFFSLSVYHGSAFSAN